MLPTVPIPAPTTTPRTTNAAPAGAFDQVDLAAIAEAGGVFAVALADIAHHHIGDPGFWDVAESGPDELARLRDVLDQMSEAIRQSRRELAVIERRVRRRAVRIRQSGGTA